MLHEEHCEGTPLVDVDQSEHDWRWGRSAPLVVTSADRGHINPNVADVAFPWSDSERRQLTNDMLLSLRVGAIVDFALSGMVKEEGEEVGGEEL